jgi:hypothetical protein
MGIYRVMVTSRLEEVFEIDAADEEEAARDWFDGHVVRTEADDPEVQSVELIDVEGER